MLVFSGYGFDAAPVRGLPREPGQIAPGGQAGLHESQWLWHHGERECGPEQVQHCSAMQM